MDEELAVQSDGATQAKRPRVQVGFGGSADPRLRLVDHSSPLPVDAREMTDLLHDIRDELREMKMLLHEIVNE